MVQLPFLFLACELLDFTTENRPPLNTYPVVYSYVSKVWLKQGLKIIFPLLHLYCTSLTTDNLHYCHVWNWDGHENWSDPRPNQYK